MGPARLGLQDVTPLLITSDVAGSHVTTAGVPVTFSGFPALAPLDVDGVAFLSISKGAVTAFCSGVLLDGGMSVMTAAHCVTDAVGVKNAGGITATWQTFGGVVNGFSSGASTTVHPGWNGNPEIGNDLAIISFAAPISTSVPRYDINRSTSDVTVGDPRIKVGYGSSGHGSTGQTIVFGTKRAGLNSFDVTFGVSTIVGSDFDNGLAANDAFGVAAGVNHLGFGIHEIGAAQGDSGGPTFYQANDSKLTLSPGAALGSFIVGNVPSQSLTVTKNGSNSTSYSVTYSGNHTNSNVPSAPFAVAGDLTDHKIAAITSAGGRLDNDVDNNGIPEFPQPDFDGVTNFGWGEVNIDTRVSSFQSFIDPFLPAPPAASTQNVTLNINDATPGAKSATVTIDNLATTNEFSDSGAVDPNDTATFTATVLGHSNASFNGVTDQNTMLIDFGIVPQFSSPASIPFSLFDLDPNAGFTAKLDLDSITPAGAFSAFNTTLAPFFNLNAGSSNGFLATIITTSLGTFTATYTLTNSDENIPGATSGTSLVLTLTGQIVSTASIPIPEPSTLALMSMALCGAAVRWRSGRWQCTTATGRAMLRRTDK